MFASLQINFSIQRVRFAMIGIEKNNAIEDFDRCRFDIVAITRTCGIAVGHFSTGRTVMGRFEPWTLCGGTAA
jgi:hypothetical protein